MRVVAAAAERAAERMMMLLTRIMLDSHVSIRASCSCGLTVLTPSAHVTVRFASMEILVVGVHLKVSNNMRYR